MIRGEYPRPQLVRRKWYSLNGEWDFQFEDSKQMKITVPFVYQCELSGVNIKESHDNVTYNRSFSVDKNWKGSRIFLNFNAVDYFCRVYVNGQLVGSHEGSSAPFSFDITDTLTFETENVTVKVFDPLTDETIPRGKQYWIEAGESIWYTQTTGIWQSVWLEPLPETRLDNIKFTPNIDTGMVTIDFEVLGSYLNKQAFTNITFKGEPVYSGTFNVINSKNTFSVDLFNNRIMRSMNHNDGWCWTPENPNLFDVEISLLNNNQTLDNITSYFGMRKVHCENGLFYLNNRPYYQKLVLDQGYFEKSLLTAPSEENFKQDILLSKEMGFNGCRKHQKAEDCLFLYWADKLGFLVWGEIPSAPSYSTEAVRRITNEWFEIVKRDYNHPSIVAWVTLNESWGVPSIQFNECQQAHALGLYNTVKSIDNTRLIIGNDGWEMLVTDICAIHNYEHGRENELFKQKEFGLTLKTREAMLSAMPAKRPVFVPPYEYTGQPIILSEFGGIAFEKNRNQDKDWGYTTAGSEDEFLRVYKRIIDNIYDSECIFGFCYTQLYDVEQEINGLLTADRKFKVSPEKIREINNMRYVKS